MQEVVKVEEGVNVAEGKQQQEHIFASGTAGLPLHFLFFFSSRCCCHASLSRDAAAGGSVVYYYYYMLFFFF